MAGYQAALKPPASVLIEEHALLAALTEAHHRGTCCGEFGIEGDSPAETGFRMIVEADWNERRQEAVVVPLTRLMPASPITTGG